MPSARRKHSRLARAAESSDARHPPGPALLPFLGSVSVLWALIRKVPLAKVLSKLRARYGPIFMLKFGPMRQVWIGDLKLLQNIYDREDCSGRPAPWKDPFGGNFLFLVREPARAAELRPLQKQWIEENVKEAAVKLTVDAALKDILWTALDKEGPLAWPALEVRRAMYFAVIRALLGDCEVTEAELDDIMVATKEYSSGRRQRGRKRKSEAEPHPGAATIRRIVSTVLERAGRTDLDQALPLVVAASIGGAEILPGFIHWIMLYYAAHRAEQEDAAEAALAFDSALLLSKLYAVLRRVPYSVAIGPPRRVMSDAEIGDMTLPSGAMLFAMHPAITDSAVGLQASTKAYDADFSEFAFGVGTRTCLGRTIAEAVLPAVAGGLLRRYRVSFGKSSDTMPEGDLQGQLMVPVKPPALRWEPRI